MTEQRSPTSSVIVPNRSGLHLARLLWREKWLIAAAFVLLWHARVIVSLRRVGDPRQAFGTPSTGNCAPAALAIRVSWAIDVAARLVFRSTCLVRAMAGRQLLALRGYGSDVHVGVAHTNGAGFEAHAWLVSGGRTVLGGDTEELSRFTRIIGGDA